MTQEDKARAYDEALQRALVVKMRNPFNAVGQMVEHIFPELKESEDERIRKAIKRGIRHLETQLGYDAVDGVDILDIYSWLEKQGHMLDPDKVIEWFRVNWWDSHIGDPIEKFKKDFGL